MAELKAKGGATMTLIVFLRPVTPYYLGTLLSKNPPRLEWTQTDRP